MRRKELLDCISCSLADTRHNTAPFGGICVVMAGDFRQTLPVVPGAGRAQQVQHIMKKSALWGDVETLTFTQNMRAHRRLAQVRPRPPFRMHLHHSWLLTSLLPSASSLSSDAPPLSALPHHRPPFDWPTFLLEVGNGDLPIINPPTCFSVKMDERLLLQGGLPDLIA